LLANHQSVMPAGMRRLPATSQVLEAATKGGVEVSPDGHVYGRLVGHRSCGNDAIWWSVRRVDLAQLLTYVKEGESSLNLNKDSWIYESWRDADRPPRFYDGGFRKEHFSMMKKLVRPSETSRQ